MQVSAKVTLKNTKEYTRESNRMSAKSARELLLKAHILKFICESTQENDPIYVTCVAVHFGHMDTLNDIKECIFGFLKLIQDQHEQHQVVGSIADDMHLIPYSQFATCHIEPGEMSPIILPLTILPLTILPLTILPNTILHLTILPNTIIHL